MGIGWPFASLYSNAGLDRGCAVQVACLSAAPLEEGAAAAALVAVGTWDRNVHMLALPSLAAACPPEALGGDVIPRRQVPPLAANTQPLTLKAKQRCTCKHL